MFTTKVRSLAFILGATVCMWSCGDDDDSTGATGGKSAGGSAGKGGAANAGSTSKGGTTNTGGTTSGGATAKGGSTSTGGKSSGGSTGVSGGGAGGAAGAGEGGGGAGGTMGGAGAGGGGGEMNGGAGAGGGGGEGGEAPLTLSQACSIACVHVNAKTCATTDPGNSCETRCTTLYDASQSPSVADSEPKKSADIARLNREYADLMRCLATKVTSDAGYVCRDPANEAPPANWSPAATGACEAELCTWTLDDQNVADPDVFDRCSQ